MARVLSESAAGVRFVGSLTQGLARECAADWSSRFDPEQRAALQAVVRTAFIDTAACILAGREEEVTRIVLRWTLGRAGQASRQASTLFGEHRLAADEAALVNGVAGHALDYDDVGLAGHPSVVLIPTLLAVHEAGEARGFELIQAYAKGYAAWGELQRRPNVSLHARGWHPTAVYGAVAAAVAVASLRRLRADQAAHALGIAASFAAGVVANFGSMIKPLHIGRAAQAGIQAVDLAQAGFDASPDALHGPSGLLAALCGPGNANLEPGLGADFDTTLLGRRPGIKKYPICYAAHRVVDGVLDLSARHGIVPGEVASVDATISTTTAGVLRQHRPSTIAEARFSLEFAVAAAMVRGALGLRDVSEDVLADPQVRSLVPLVRTHTTDTRCPLEPSFAYEDRVTVTLRDGSVLDSGPIRFARGHAELPLDERQLQQKLLACVLPHEAGLARSVLSSIDAALGGEPAATRPSPQALSSPC